MHDDLAALVRANTALIAIEAPEDGPIVEAFKRAIAGSLRPLHTWSITRGLQRIDMDGLPAVPASASDALDIIHKTSQRSIFLLFEFVPFVRYVATLRHLREIAQRFNCAAHTVVLVAPKLELPAELESLTTRFTPRLPNADELGQMVRDAPRPNPRPVPVDDSESAIKVSTPAPLMPCLPSDERTRR